MYGGAHRNMVQKKHRTHAETGTSGPDSNGCADVCRRSMNRSSERAGESSTFQPWIADSRRRRIIGYYTISACRKKAILLSNQPEHVEKLLILWGAPVKLILGNRKVVFFQSSGFNSRSSQLPPVMVVNVFISFCRSWGKI